jgi:hypothetical protein
MKTSLFPENPSYAHASPPHYSPNRKRTSNISQKAVGIQFRHPEGQDSQHHWEEEVYNHFMRIVGTHEEKVFGRRWQSREQLGEAWEEWLGDETEKDKRGSDFKARIWKDTGDVKEKGTRWG